jgi:diguanylate cyclase (GGDEF)-like protein/PAS domain S-box-containing protein
MDNFTAYEKVKQKRSRVILLHVLAACFLVIGFFHIVSNNQEYQQKKTAHAIDLARAASAFISADLINELNAAPGQTRDDIGIKKGLTHFKDNIESVASVFIYPQDYGGLAVLVDSEPSETTMFDPLIQEYWEVLQKNEPVLTETGSWKTVLVPLEERQTGEMSAVLGMNYSAAEWNRDIIRNTAHVSLEVLLAFVFLAVIFRMFKSNSLLSGVSKRLNEREAVFKTLFDHLPLGVALSEDGKPGSTNVNHEFEKILGISQREASDISLEKLTDPDDSSHDAQRLAQFKQGKVSSYRTVKKIDKPDGQTAWIDMHVVSLSKDDHKSGKSHLCIVEDVTQRLLTETALRESERSKAVLLAHLPGMAYRCRYDRDWTMLFVSEGCYKLTGYEPESLLYNKDVSYNDLIAPEYRDTIWMEWVQILALKTPFHSEYEIIDKEGRRKWVMEMGQGIYDEEGNVVALEGLIIDVTEQKMREAQIKHMSDHDFLTGLYNRKFFEEAKARLEDDRFLPVSVIIANINGVRLINDAFGDAEGDRVIIEAASFIKRRCREGDILARTGGDEFSLLLPNTDSHEAYSIVRQIKKACEQHNMMNPSRQYDVSVTMGFGTKTINEETIDKAAKEAEEYMHNRKLLNRRSSHSTILASIMATMFERSQETEEHAERLSRLSKEVGEMLQLPQKSLDELELFAMLHDIGKVGIDDRILNKPGKLNDEEWAVMKKHPEIGYRIAVSSPELEPIAEYILSHHERWDGNGYPQGLKGEDIPLLSRILSVADAYDAMTEDRVYRKALSKHQALKEIENNAGTQFDPVIAQRFIEIMS